MKQYNLMLSKHFPAHHPRKGNPTNFSQLVEDVIKLHTVRGNYALWSKRIDEVLAGNDGLGVVDFYNWFRKSIPMDGIIIHFTKFRYQP